jgi:hypothetical protein
MMAQELRISGIKLSPELILLRLLPGVNPPPQEIIKQLAARRINLTCVVLHRGGDKLSGFGCIDAKELPRVEKILASVTTGIEKTTSVGSLTVFPHRCRMDLLAAGLRAFSRSGIPLLGVASSLSALSFILPYRRLDDAVRDIVRIAPLPVNHAPLRPHFYIRQI